MAVSTLAPPEKSTNVRDKSSTRVGRTIRLTVEVTVDLGLGLAVAVLSGLIIDDLSGTVAAPMPAALAGTAAWVWLAVAVGAPSSVARIGCIAAGVVTSTLSVGAFGDSAIQPAIALGVHAAWAARIVRLERGPKK